MLVVVSCLGRLDLLVRGYAHWKRFAVVVCMLYWDKCPESFLFFFFFSWQGDIVTLRHHNFCIFGALLVMDKKPYIKWEPCEFIFSDDDEEEDDTTHTTTDDKTHGIQTTATSHVDQTFTEDVVIDQSPGLVANAPCHHFVSANDVALFRTSTSRDKVYVQCILWAQDRTAITLHVLLEECSVPVIHGVGSTLTQHRYCPGYVVLLSASMLTNDTVFALWGSFYDSIRFLIGTPHAVLPPLQMSDTRRSPITVLYSHN
jgi:hypothetical protein